eukprot:4182593-Amphidinium_carterae.1
MGIKEPQATFSACFGGPFLALHPGFYAKMLSPQLTTSKSHHQQHQQLASSSCIILIRLAAKLEKFGATAWLVNSGWVGGPYGVGERSRCPCTAM